MPLTLMQVGEKGIIRKVSGGEDTRRYLGNLGFVSQASLEVVNKLNENVIVSICGSRIALNADMARHLLNIDHDMSSHVSIECYAAAADAD